MTDPLRDVRSKLTRAGKHLRDLETRVHRWPKTHPIGVVHHHDRNTGWHTLRAQALPELPEQWSNVLADYAINLRIALDYLIRQLVIANDGTPERNNKFPIFPVPPKKGWLRDALRGIHPDARAHIKNLQPYLRPDRAEPEPLEVLAAFANVDKHVRPHAALVLMAPFDQRSVEFIPKKNVSGLIMRIPINVGSPVSDADLIAMHFDPPEAEVEMHMKRDLPADVAFGDGLVPMWKVRDLIRVVRGIVDDLRPFVMNPPPAA